MDVSAELIFPMVKDVPNHVLQAISKKVRPLAELVPSLMVRFSAVTVVGWCTSEELSTVQPPPYCGDTYSVVGNLIRQRSRMLSR